MNRLKIFYSLPKYVIDSRLKFLAVKNGGTDDHLTQIYKSFQTFYDSLMYIHIVLIHEHLQPRERGGGYVLDEVEKRRSVVPGELPPFHVVVPYRQGMGSGSAMDP